ncbi:MAG: phosphoribosylformylglycinamidine synthase-associated small membrane protein [Hyphomicrobiaceae bacterium]|nr:phosphoribosylformylglycinamidine synthase-associated small membrane protein [Hyphomicrobiaceae bacterium]
MRQTDPHDDAVRAIRFMAVKAAIFILIPLIAALVAVWWRFG